ncbi:hypothetical protein N7523_009003 [Penicillium sp. IBT 18751x]|nr:hypothetical protein N7523_009003 [Penicillium sp. IBT 18751x]
MFTSELYKVDPTRDERVAVKRHLQLPKAQIPRQTSRRPRPYKSNRYRRHNLKYTLALKMAQANAHPSQTASSAPSPPASEPEVPGLRASRLIQVFDQALARTLRANSYANFASCFPTPARHVPASLENVWRQLNAKLEESAKAEFEEIVEERQAVQHLNELDRLVGDARARKEAERDGAEPEKPPHTLGAEELYNAHLTPYLEETQAALNKKFEATATENGELAQTVQAQRLEIERLLAHLESVVGDIEDAAKAASQFSEKNHIREDALQMDEEVNAQPGI